MGTEPVEMISTALRPRARLCRFACKETSPSGGYYIIAPENAESGSVDINQWDEIWQYGSNEDEMDKPWLLDGVAPQTPVTNIMDRRANIPDNMPKGFLDSHYIKNYGWIFSRQDNDKGYVKPRK